MSAAVVREARSGEECVIVPMYEWLFASPGSLPSSWDEDRAAAALAAAIAAEDATVLLADDGGELCGYCTAYIDIDSVRFGRRCWVEDFAVDPGRRSQGIGATLLDAAKEWGRAHGASHLELDSGNARVDAHRFYEREGGVATGKQFAWQL